MQMNQTVVVFHSTQTKFQAYSFCLVVFCS